MLQKRKLIVITTKVFNKNIKSFFDVSTKFENKYLLIKFADKVKYKSFTRGSILGFIEWNVF